MSDPVAPVKNKEFQDYLREKRVKRMHSWFMAKYTMPMVHGRKPERCTYAITKN